VLRRIIRRAIRYIWKLGALQADGLFWRMVEPLVEMMGGAYPELAAKRSFVEQALKAEEAAFAQTLDAGMQRLENALNASGGRIDGEQLFQFHDTYGCPPDLILDVLRERGAEPAPDAVAQYERLMEQQRERAARRQQVRRQRRPASGAGRLAVADVLPRLRHAGCGRLHGGCDPPRGQAGAERRRWRGSRRAARQDAFLRRVRRPGRRHRRAVERRPACASRCATPVKLSAIFHGHVGAHRIRRS
jgi:hypothetical protein